MRRQFAVLAAAVVASSLVAMRTEAVQSPVVSSATSARAANAASTQVGKPYVWGSTSPAVGFDSSGLVVWAFARVGVRRLPRDADSLWHDGEHVRRTDLRAGDVVFFGEQHSHVGIYLGSGRYVHAPHTGAVVRIDRLGAGELARMYSGAVRLFRPSLARR